MLINVPQYIDVEDKVAGPLTAKQLLWMVALGIILLILWNVVPKPVFFIIGIPLAILFIALAFFKPYGQPLGSFVLYGILYYFRPKIYVWKRTGQRMVQVPQHVESKPVHTEEKKLTTETLQGLAQLLDSEGANQAEGLEQILKKLPTKKA